MSNGKALRGDANTARCMAVVRRTHKETSQTDRDDYNTLSSLARSVKTRRDQTSRRVVLRLHQFNRVSLE